MLLTLWHLSELWMWLVMITTTDPGFPGTGMLLSTPGNPIKRSTACQALQTSVATQGAESYHAMRSLDRSPGCTPVVGMSPGTRVRMHSCPGHDNFAPMKSSTASPGGTPHARGQGHHPSVRMDPVAAAGHDNFNPLRSQIASPGCTPVRSVSPIASGHPASDVESAAGSSTIMPYSGNICAPSCLAPSPAAPSDGTSNTEHMHVVVVSRPGHDHFHPVHIANRSPGHTPRHSANLSGSTAPEVQIMGGQGHDSFSPMHAGERSPGHTPGPPGAHHLAHSPCHSAEPAKQHGEHVAFVSSPCHDHFHPLAASNASPGHTPRPSAEPLALPHVQVTSQSEAGRCMSAASPRHSARTHGVQV